MKSENHLDLEKFSAKCESWKNPKVGEVSSHETYKTDFNRFSTIVNTVDYCGIIRVSASWLPEYQAGFFIAKPTKNQVFGGFAKRRTDVAPSHSKGFPNCLNT